MSRSRKFDIRIFQLKILSFWPTAECRAEQSFAWHVAVVVHSVAFVHFMRFKANRIVANRSKLKQRNEFLARNVVTLRLQHQILYSMKIEHSRDVNNKTQLTWFKQEYFKNSSIIHQMGTLCRKIVTNKMRIKPYFDRINNIT